MKPLVKILLIEDDEDDALLAREYLSEIETYQFLITWEPDLANAKKAMLQGDHDIFLIDYRLGSENGLELISFVQGNDVFTPAIVLTGQGDMEVDRVASRMGAADYLVKAELSSSVLERTIRYALSHATIVKELNEKEKKYRLLFERSVDPIFLATRNFKLMDGNHSFLKFFGYSLGELSSVALENIFLQASDFENFKSVLKTTEQVKDLEVTLLTKSSEPKVCFLNGVFIPHESEEFCCYQCIVHDLTMRKQAEQDMLVAERLALTGKIARTMAHEVRNPLTNLNLAFDQLKSELPIDNEAVKLYGDIIERNVHRIELLVGEMLDSSRPKELRLQLHAVHDILDSTIELAIDRIKLRHVSLRKNYQADLPRILVDKEKICIALLNIIINGLEAMQPEQGVLTIAASLHDHIITIQISDNGKGIAPENMKRLFDPFFTGKQSGMGLGLTSTKNILNSHSASIEVTSAINKGTSFYIHFTLAN